MRVRFLVLFGIFSIVLAGCGSNPCRKACTKLKTCLAGERTADATEPAAAETESTDSGEECPLAKTCNSEQECMALCTDRAPCEALTGVDLAAAAELARCQADCARPAPDAGEAGDGFVISEGGKSCAPPKVACGGSCVSLAIDPRHCGKCGHACGPSELCVASSCQAQAGDCSASGCPKGYYCDLGSSKCLAGCAVDDQCEGARCNLARHVCCAPGESVCSDACVDTRSSTTHCGGCGKSCPAVTGGHPVCQLGSCDLGCDGGRTLCGSQCVLTASDLQNCGGCGQPCKKPYGGSAVCQGGSCLQSCATAGQTVCDGSCVDVLTDPGNCGTCGNECSAANGTATCTAGSCGLSCPTGKTPCSGQCVDLQTDINNCGSCGKKCPAGQTGVSYPKCSAGTCGYSCSYSAIQCANTCCATSEGHCCTGKDSYTGKTYGYCLKYGYNCYN